MPKILIAYFTHSGNTKVIAEKVFEILGGDLFEITTVEPYPNVYDLTSKRAKRELQHNERPRLAEQVKDMSAYDIIILGYPNWCSTIPTPICSFLESYDFTNKTILPFCTHGGGGTGRSESDIKMLCPNADVAHAFSINGTRVDSAKKALSGWLDSFVD